MLRAGMIRMISAGLYTYLPFGLLALRKVESIVREEMDRIGGQEFAFSTLVPKELWETSGRWQTMQADLFSTQIAPESQYILAPTHEESFTDFAAKHIFSYTQLPVIFYQITTKFRNEKRPRYGVMRSREFLMKDAYSFSMSDDCLDATYETLSGVYTKIFTRCELVHHIVKADSGAMGGSASQEFVVLNPFGENTIAFCQHCKAASNVEAAKEHFEETSSSLPILPLEIISTPGKKSIEEVSAFLQISPQRMVKSLFYQVEGDICMVLVRGDRVLNESKLGKIFLGKNFQIADAQQVEKLLRSPAGFWGPIQTGCDFVTFVDESVKSVQMGVVGANQIDAHYRNFSPLRDLKQPYSWVDVCEVVQGSICGDCKKGTLNISKGIELGHLFKLGKKYSQAFSMKVAQESGEKIVPTMGCYGIGVNRLLAAIIEQHHDDKGITWPLSMSPFQVVIVTLGDDRKLMEQSKFLYENLQKQGYSILWDDRKESAGFKLADADLLGVPYQIILGKKFLQEDLVEVRDRKSRESQYVAMDYVLALLS